MGDILTLPNTEEREVEILAASIPKEKRCEVMKQLIDAVMDFHHPEPDIKQKQTG